MLLVGERPDRGQVPQEHLGAVTVRPAMADLVSCLLADQRGYGLGRAQTQIWSCGLA
jgi:hypothetical protein